MTHPLLSIDAVVDPLDSKKRLENRENRLNECGGEHHHYSNGSVCPLRICRSHSAYKPEYNSYYRLDNISIQISFMRFFANTTFFNARITKWDLHWIGWTVSHSNAHTDRYSTTTSVLSYKWVKKNLCENIYKSDIKSKIKI